MFERACRSEDLPAFGGPANATCATPSDRKSTRLNSSHDQISYAVFCLKKKKRPCTHEKPIVTNSVALAILVNAAIAWRDAGVARAGSIAGRARVRGIGSSHVCADDISI